MAPVGLESDNRNLNLGMQLARWALGDGRGKAFGPTGE